MACGAGAAVPNQLFEISSVCADALRGMYSSDARMSGSCARTVLEQVPPPIILAPCLCFWLRCLFLYSVPFSDTLCVVLCLCLWLCLWLSSRDQDVFSCSFSDSLSHAHCTCCVDLTKGAQDKYFSYSFSILSHAHSGCLSPSFSSRGPFWLAP